MLDAITDDDVKQIVRALVNRARNGDVRAAREVLDRVVGKPTEPPPIDGNANSQYPILVTTTAEALKNLEAKRDLDDDPLRGLKRLPKGGGK